MFEFRLKNILNFRQHLYKTAQISLAVAQQQYQKIHEQREELNEEINRQDQVWKEKQECGMGAAEHCFYRDYLESLERRLATLDEQLEKALNEVEQARQALLERKKEAQILDSLEQDAKQDYRIFQQRKEQQQLDELSIFADYHKHASN